MMRIEFIATLPTNVPGTDLRLTWNVTATADVTFNAVGSDHTVERLRITEVHAQWIVYGDCGAVSRPLHQGMFDPLGVDNDKVLNWITGELCRGRDDWNAILSDQALIAAESRMSHERSLAAA